MSPLYLTGGKLLVRNGLLAVGSDCCCDLYYCYKSNIAVPCPSECEGENNPTLGYYFFTATDAENVIDDVEIPGWVGPITFTRIDEETFQSDSDPVITMTKQPGPPVPKNTICGGIEIICPCPRITGSWYIEGWDLGSPSGKIILDNPYCNPDYFTTSLVCGRDITVFDYPSDGQLPTCFPRKWDSSSGKVTLYAKFCEEDQYVVVKEVDWDITYCPNPPKSQGECLGFNMRDDSFLNWGFVFWDFIQKYNASICSQTDYTDIPADCCHPQVYQDCTDCSAGSNIEKAISSNPWTETTMSGGVRFTGTGDWYNRNNWTDASGNSPATPLVNWNKTIEGIVNSSLYGIPLALGGNPITLTGTISIPFNCANMTIDGGTIDNESSAECQSGGIIGIATFLFKNSAKLKNPVILQGNGRFETQSTNSGQVEGSAIFDTGASNTSNGTVAGSATFKLNTINLGIVTGEAIFEQNSTNANEVNNTNTTPAAPPAIFTDTAKNNSTVIGDAIFRVNAENGNYVGGNATFEGSSKNNLGGLIGGESLFKDSSKNYGNTSSTAALSATFEDSSENHATVQGDALFKGNSKNYGTVTGSATFEGYSENKSTGSIGGDALFKGNSKNYGGVSGTATFQDSACNSGTAGAFDPDPPLPC